ncbi:hypothetical protein TWF718_005280 [Orbilia javanica]|uniref:Uncharacterized protein n=1 Tax=Orbilia javanica TaxID=47235 RepID=A0AAN8RIP9_9PEZI
MRGPTIKSASSGRSTTQTQQAKSGNCETDLGLVDQHRSVCMACGRPVNPAHGICVCGIQNGKPGELKGDDLGK